MANDNQAESSGNGSRYRVAMDLMYQIARDENVPAEGAREYWIDLYVTCLKATREVKN